MPEMTWEATVMRSGKYLIERCNTGWDAYWQEPDSPMEFTEYLGTFTHLDVAKAAAAEHAQQREGRE